MTTARRGSPADAAAVTGVARALIDDRYQMTSQWITAEDAVALVDHGWSLERYATLWLLGMWRWTETSHSRQLDDNTDFIAHAAERATLDGGAPWTELLPWLEVLAGDADALSAERLSVILVTSPWPVFAASWAGLPASLAALTHAAGLTRAEIAIQRDAPDGGLEEQTLRTVAALRGYRLPPGGAHA